MLTSTAGWVANSVVALLLIVNDSAWRASSAGPALIPVAKLVTVLGETVVCSGIVGPVPTANVGASLTGVIVMWTVAVAVPPLSSEMVYVKVSLPLASALGVYVRSRPFTLTMTVPSAPFVAPVMSSGVSRLMSVSLARTLIVVAVASSRMAGGVSSSATGAVFRMVSTAVSDRTLVPSIASTPVTVWSPTAGAVHTFNALHVPPAIVKVVFEV